MHTLSAPPAVETLIADAHARAIHQRQRRYLHRLIKHEFREARPIQHDFACGTGRGIALLAGSVYDAYGYDVSTSVLERARTLGHRAHWQEITASGPVPQPQLTDGPTIVTVFRLMLNVPDEVRDRAIAFAAEALPSGDSGLLVVQNHGSRRSLRHLRAYKHVNNPWYAEMTDDQLYAFLHRYGFRLIERRGFALFPRGWYRSEVTRPIITRLDTVLCRLRIFDRYAVDVLYVARRSHGA